MLKMTQSVIPPEPAEAGDSSDDGLDAFMHEDHESEEEPVEERSPKEESIIKLKDKISLLRHRCESGLGSLLFEQVYAIIKENKDSKVSGEKTREQLLEVLGKENIGFWAIIDNILFLEGMKQGIEAS